MKRHTTTPGPVKASDSVVSRMLAKLLGVTPSDILGDVRYEFCDAAAVDSPLRLLIAFVHSLYPWVTEVARDIMNDASTPLAEHLLAMPGVVYLAKDSVASGAESLWVVVADPDPEVLSAIQRMCCRGLFHTFKIGEELSMILAVQLSSCRP